VSTRDLITLADYKFWLDGLFNGRPHDSHPRADHAIFRREQIAHIGTELILRADNHTIKVQQRRNSHGVLNDTNTFWLNVNGRLRHATYTHKSFLFRDGGRTGRQLGKIDGTSTPSQIVVVVKSL